jgi:hypothetical protein
MVCQAAFDFVTVDFVHYGACHASVMSREGAAFVDRDYVAVLSALQRSGCRHSYTHTCDAHVISRWIVLGLAKTL